MLRKNCLLLVVATCLAVALGAADEANDDVVRLVVGLLSESDKDLRALGLDQVRSEAKGQAATEQFAALLPKLPPDAQVGLLGALADRGDAAARPAVLAVLASSRAADVRVAAIGALGSLGEVADLPLLLQSLGAAAKAETLVARASLIRLRGQTVPTIIAETMKQSPAPVHVALIEILTTRRALETLPQILESALDADAKIRAAAMTALGQLGGPEQIPGMVRGVLQAGKGAERDAAERAVALVCGRIANADQRAAPLLAAIDTLAESDRTAMLSTLARVGGPQSLAIVEAAIANTDASVHEAGLRALCNWPDASIAPRLIELARGDDHPQHRAIALAALIRVAPLPDGRPADERLALLQKVMAMCHSDQDRNLVIKRARAIRTIETLRYLAPYLDQPAFAQEACESVVELAHHRELRQPNKAEFHRALDKVIATSSDAVVIERANRYKKEQTWVRPKPAEKP